MSTKRTRVYFDADEDLKLAIQMEALKAGRSASDLIGQALRERFKDALAEARKTIQQRKKSQP